MNNIMSMLCTKLDGWNLSTSPKESMFDFYSPDGKAILTMVYRNNTIYITDDVEYYAQDVDSESISLEDYNKILGE